MLNTFFLSTMFDYVCFLGKKSISNYNKDKPEVKIGFAWTQARQLTGEHLKT